MTILALTANAPFTFGGTQKMPNVILFLNMPIEIKKPVTNKKPGAALKKLATAKKKKTKGFDAKRFFGKVDFGIDGLAYQKMMRSEWDWKEK